MTRHRGSHAAAAAEAAMAATTGAGLDLSAAMVRAESRDLDARLRALIDRLDSVPGLEMRVTYRHGRLRRLIGDLPYVNDLHRTVDPVREIVVTVGHHVYRLHAEHGSIRCATEAMSIERGQVEERLPFSAWAATLFDEISRQNLVNHESLVALRQLVEQDRVD